jgi:hypothetical protein
MEADGQPPVLESRPTAREKIVATNTINADYLRMLDHKNIGSFMRFEEDEELILVWMDGGRFDEILDPYNNTIVGLTTNRLFKIQDGQKSHVMLNNIADVNHIKRSFLKWSKIGVTLKGGAKDTFGLRDDDAIKVFIAEIRDQMMTLSSECSK